MAPPTTADDGPHGSTAPPLWRWLIPSRTPAVFELALALNGATNHLPCRVPSLASYAFTQSSGASVVPGANDIGNHGDNIVSTANLPFPFAFYGQSFSNASVSANGHLQFL